MKKKSNIRRSGHGQEFEFTVCLKGNTKTLVHLKPLVAELGRLGLPRWRRALRDPWEVLFWLMLGMFVMNFFELLARAFS